jgi:hypothetical protein
MTDAPETEAAYWRAYLARQEAETKKADRWFPWQLGFLVVFTVVYMAGSIAAGAIIGDRLSHVHLKACINP